MRFAKAPVLGAVLGAVLALAAVQWSCTIDRPSESLKCYSQNDCTQFPGTICSSGYCVTGTLPPDARALDAAVCPATCNGGCDFATTTCTITGTGSGNIVCPTGWKCGITCGQQGACGTITCGGGLSCDVNCLAGSACLGVSCGGAACNVTCTGDHACANITSSGGKVTATCSGSAACGNVSCQGSANCTETCSGGGGQPVCGSLSCAAGACSRNCSGSDACGNMTCSTGACSETCSGGALACGTVNAGTGKLTATCQGLQGACDNVNCSNSCQCDISCDVASNICPGSMSCPDPNGGAANECQDTFGRCDSSTTPARCQKCQ